MNQLPRSLIDSMPRLWQTTEARERRYSTMKLRFAWIAVGLLIAFSAVGSAAIMEFTATDQKDNLSDLSVAITIEDVTGGVKISANVVGGTNDQIGDLIGLHFRVNGTAPETVVISNVTANDMLPTAPQIDYSKTSNAMNPYQFGMNFFEIGDNGIGSNGWDIQMVSFTVATTLQASDFTAAGARLTSVGTIGGSRRGSLKLIDTAPDTPSVEEIPEPSTWLMLSAGIGLLALARRRRAA